TFYLHIHPSLGGIEILGRFIKYKWLPLEAFLNFQKLKEMLKKILQASGYKYGINFY
ncbi:hypothetical protein EZS27_037314, partial [termite gut metagenome]